MKNAHSSREQLILIIENCTAAYLNQRFKNIKQLKKMSSLVNIIQAFTGIEQNFNLAHLSCNFVSK